MRALIGLIGAVGLSLSAAAGSAFAADLPAKAPLKALYAPAPVQMWAGFYAGVNVGAAWGTGAAYANLVDDSMRLSGIIGGAQIGYNLQSSWLVVGLETDIQASSQNHTETVGAVTFNQRVPYFGTLRSRVGYAQDNWLLYVTSGLVYGKYNVDATVTGLTASSSSRLRPAVIGGGLEWMFMPRWSAKLEYLYFSTDLSHTTAFAVPFETRLRDNVLRVGLNYHF